MSLEKAIVELQKQVKELRAEADARRVLAKYMFLCDAPFPLYEKTLEERATAIAECFTDDAIWEGIGGAHASQFGRKVGRNAIAEHMRGFFGGDHANQIFNVHYVSMGQIWCSGDHVEGVWPQMQPWIYDDGSSLLRSSRVRVTFEETSAGWKIKHYRTENLFIADLPDNWPRSLIDTVHLMKQDS